MVLAGAPADFGKLIADETEKWAKGSRTSSRGGHGFVQQLK
jgi:hypothetical protein